MRCLELFAGGGGAALGLERAGFEHAALCEWDRDACATLRAAGLGPVVEGDVRDLDSIAAAAGPAPVDVLWASFPCQAFSTAGKRLGAADERNGWPWTVAAVDRFRPSWFMGENVRGLLLHTGGCAFAGGQEGLFSRPDPALCPGCYFERVILPDLRARFTCVGWWLLDAADYGVPQHRRRVILWAGPRPLAQPVATHGPGAPLPWVSMGEALGLRVFCFATHAEGAVKVADRRVRELTHRPSVTIGALNDELGGHPWVPMTTKPVNGWAREDAIVDGPSPPITCQLAQQAKPWLSTGLPWLARPSPTVSAIGEEKGSGAGGHPEKMQRASDALYLATGRRRLTVAECATLQDFPCGHPFQGSIGAHYRQIGNAVPPRLAEVVGRAIMDAT